MRAHVVIQRDPFHPQIRREIFEVRRRRRVRGLAPRTRQPYMAFLNGEPILRAAWNRRLRDGDTLAFVILPQGGKGGSNVIAAVIGIVMMFFSGPLGSGVASSLMGEVGATTFIGGTSITGSMVATAAISVAGSAIMNAALSSPALPSTQQAAALAAPSPTYSLQAQGNAARIESAIPVQYGRLRCFPDYAALPYAEFVGNEQYLYQLLCIGVGEYAIEQIRIEDTSISSFADIEYEIVPPGAAVTLFPANVATSGEVSGQNALQGVWIGPFVANAPGTTANAIAIDMVCPRGLFHVHSETGELEPISVTWTVEARQIDDDGVPLAGYATLGTESLNAATTTPQRASYRYPVLPGRYEVRLQRISAPGGSTEWTDDLAWAGLRAYLPETRDFGNVTLLAMRMRASNNLSAQASRKINVVCTRKLKIYTPGIGWGASAVPTRSIAWAFADACKADYGGRLNDAQIGLDHLAALDAVWAARGDAFDGRFDNTLTLWEALTKIARAGRAKPYRQGGIVHVARDQAQTVPVAMFSMRNIVKNSLSIDYLMPTEDTADAIDATYFDDQVWAPRRVRATLPGSTAARPVKIDFFGIVQREHVMREALYEAGSNRYRRKLIRFQTEMDGMIPSFLDLIAISHDMPQWGYSGEILAHDVANTTLTLSEPVEFTAGTHYLALRRRDGAIDGPYAVTAGSAANVVVYTGVLGVSPYLGQTEERTHYAFGPGENWRQLARVLSVKPRGLHHVEIECVAEDPSVHTADAGAVAAPVQSSLLPNLYTRPVVSGLTVRSDRTDVSVMLISWRPAAGARRYYLEASSDGDTWTRLGDTTANTFTARAIYGVQTIVRVAADGMTLGPWVSVAFADGSDYFWGADAAPFWGADASPFWD